MKEELFKVGSVYFDNEGDVIRLARGLHYDGAVSAHFLADDGWHPHGGCFDLRNGVCDRHPDASLIPGELHNVNGQWLPISASAPVVEEKTPEQAFDECVARAQTVMADLLNAEMIARDGPARDSHCVCRDHKAPGIVHRTDGPCYLLETKSTAHPPIPALCLSPDTAEGYRLGGRFGTAL